MLKEKILDYMRNEAYRPVNADDLVEALELTGDELKAFWGTLEEMEQTGEVIKTRHEKYGIPELMNLVVGTMSLTSKGFGFVIPDVRKSEEETDVFIPTAMLLSAMNNDRVIARVNRPAANGRTREGEIVRIIKRANTKIVGTFESSRSFGFVVADDTKIGQDIFISKQDFNGARIGEKVVVEITKWPDKLRSAEGKIIEILGMKGDPGVDILSIIKRYDLPMEFPSEVQQAAENTPDKISDEEIASRKDRRDLKIVTIDGDDAKDLDDGVYAEKRGNKYFLGVYIADVSYYVRENEPLDKEAYARGTSVYLVDRVLPMLPQRLSNGICSLNAGEDRLAMCAEMEIDMNGKVTSYEIFPTVIRVYRRLTYNIVRKILVDHDEQLTADNEDIMTELHTLEEVCGVLRKHRAQRGSIDFELPEIKVRLDSDGKPVRLEKRVRTLAESIVEQCMLAANETVAEHMAKQKLPFVYRVHEEPSSDKMERLNTLLATFNLHINHKNGEEDIEPAELQRVLKAVAGKPEERIISSVMLRSMKQARYEAQNLGHFGLAAEYYTHFTSPIRRYPDLIVHRMLRECGIKGKIAPKRREKLDSVLPEMASYASTRERLAAEAERETTDLKKIEYMAQFVGEEFDGIISGVTAFGIFVELENGIEGLVRVSSMENDYYQYVEEQYALIGERTRKQYRLGDEVKITVINANIEERNLDFILTDNGTYSVMAPQERKKYIRRESEQPVIRKGGIASFNSEKSAKHSHPKSSDKDKDRKNKRNGKKHTDSKSSLNSKAGKSGKKEKWYEAVEKKSPKASRHKRASRSQRAKKRENS